MADQSQENQHSDIQTLSKAASSAASAAKAAGYAATGNFIGAAKEVFANPQIRNAIIETIVVISLLISCGLLVVGSSITGAIIAVCNSWAEHWDENWLEQNIASNGSALYLYTDGYNETIRQTIGDVIKDIFVTDHKVDGSDASNSGIDDSTKVESKDYETLIKSIYDAEALAGRDGALMQQMDIIKNRVIQRGKQIQTFAIAQYAMDAIGLSLAEIFINKFQNPILYRGVASANVTVDIACFELSDIQALKILAAYSIQKDCSLETIDMFDLLDYCGWYDIGFSSLSTSMDKDRSIYQGKTRTMVFQDIGTVSPNIDITEKIHGLAPPDVPTWRGTFTPQWYIEEIAQINEHNDLYFSLPEDQRGDMIPWGVTSADDELDINAFDKLKNYTPYGIIDKIYSSSVAELHVTRTEYHGAAEYFLEAADAFIGSIVGEMWDEAFGDKSTTDEYGNAIGRDEANNHYYIFSNGSTGSAKGSSQEGSTTITYSYYLESENGSSTGMKYVSEGGVSFSGLDSSTTYTVWEVKKTETVTLPSFKPLDPSGSEDEQWAPLEPTLTTTYEYYHVSSFKTLAGVEERQAYQLNLDLKISFSARSVDGIAMELIGLWPGSLEATTVGSDGKVYPEEYPDNPSMVKYWEDTYTAPDGTTHNLSFERQQGYQYETYKDLVNAMAEILGISTGGLTAPDYTSGGNDIVAVALSEWEFYQANNLYEGGRYWAMVKDVLGWTYSDDTAWCVAFVWCCAYLCGYIGPDECFGNDWVFYVEGAWQQLKEAGKCDYYASSSDNYVPVPGDLIFFAYPSGGRMDMSHIGIVEKVDETGKVHVIHGNAGDRLVRGPVGNYQIGTVWDSSNGTIIYGYIHPYYPVSASNNPVYLSVDGITQGTVTSRYVTADGDYLFLSGITRLRKSQLQTFITALKETYPSVYSEELQAALDSDDMDAFISAWNKISSSSQSESFRNAQFNLTTKLYLQPLAMKVKEESGFDWLRSEIRKELFWAIATSTDQHDAVAAMLNDLTAGLSANISDTDFPTALRTNNLLGSTLTGHKDTLWPGENTTFQNSWISSITTTLTKLVSANTEYGSLSNEFYIAIDNIDPDYQGHAVPDLTPEQIAKIKNTLFGEYGSNLEACIIIAQSIRDNVDRKWPDVTYDNFVTEFKYYGGYPERDPAVYETENVNKAFEYVFVQGGSAFQHPVYCFYTPSASLTCDADYQRLFYLPLEFVYQSGTARFFSWDE